MAHVKCKICTKKFYAKPSHLKRGWCKYCSIECRNKSQFNGKTVACSQCGKKVYRSLARLRRSKSKKYFCTKSCQTIWRNSVYKRERHANWKTGRTSYRDILEKSGRKKICVLCKTTDERVLTAHHQDHNRDNNDLTNLVWLCLNCHHLIHTDDKIDKKIKNMEALV
jgi:hypothetical protein